MKKFFVEVPSRKVKREVLTLTGLACLTLCEEDYHEPIFTDEQFDELKAMNIGDTLNFVWIKVTRLEDAPLAIKVTPEWLREKIKNGDEGPCEVGTITDDIECPVCNNHLIIPVTTQQTFTLRRYNDQQVELTVEISKCQACDFEFVTPEQSKAIDQKITELVTPQ